MRNKIAVVVRTYNNEEILGKTLKAIQSQKKVDLEIYVIDSGSNDRTVEIASLYTNEIFHLVSMKYHPGKVLNKIIPEIECENIVFVNSDTVLLREDSLYNLLEDMENPFIAASYGRQECRPDAWPEVRRAYKKTFPESNNTAEWITLSLPLACIKKSIWMKRKFYVDSWGSEDTEWGKYIESQGYYIKYNFKAVAMHSHNYDIRQLYNRSFVEGEADHYIYDRSVSYTTFIRKVIGKSIRDCCVCFSEYAIRHGVSTLFRSFVSELGYLMGVRNAYARVLVGNKNVPMKSYQ
ncbi:MAG: hypothetical protein BM556_05395 [Bacteriovorax sp. MedPE-SWde]|nr:MAG: hypothetical protein BM556_05395 [Bacteriovorax sp. MedPE-SWde]